MFNTAGVDLLTGRRTLFHDLDVLLSRSHLVSISAAVYIGARMAAFMGIISTLTCVINVVVILKIAFQTVKNYCGANR